IKHLALIALLALPLANANAASGDAMNFRFSPIGLIIGAINVGMDFQVNENWTVGPELTYWRFAVSSTKNATFNEDFEITAFGGGTRANWFRNGVFTDGLYVGPHLDYASVKVTGRDVYGADVEASWSGVIAGCLVGYGWYWDSFNIMLGGGI